MVEMIERPWRPRGPENDYDCHCHVQTPGYEGKAKERNALGATQEIPACPRKRSEKGTPSPWTPDPAHSAVRDHRWSWSGHFGGPG